MFIGSRCSHAHIKGGAGPNEGQNGGKIKNDDTKFLQYKPAYSGHNALAKRVYTGRSE